MNWFDIIKVLGTKSGYAQLDFDNIVEEDEEDCKQRWLKYAEELRKLRKERSEKLFLRALLQEEFSFSRIIFFRNKCAPCERGPPESFFESGLSAYMVMHRTSRKKSNIPMKVTCTSFLVAFWELV